MKGTRPPRPAVPDADGLDLEKLEALASQPSELKRWFRDKVRGHFDALVIDPGRGVTGRDVRKRLAAVVRQAQRRPVASPRFDEVEEARPEPLTDEERVNVLSGLSPGGRR